MSHCGLFKSCAVPVPSKQKRLEQNFRHVLVFYFNHKGKEAKTAKAGREIRVRRNARPKRMG